MSDLTLEEKTGYATMRAREKEAEKHFFDLNQPHHPCEPIRFKSVAMAVMWISDELMQEPTHVD